MTDWAKLHDAYGTAEAVPGLLTAAAVARSQDDGIWDELWSRLCHQGTVYSASYAALPELARMSEHGSGGSNPPLYLAAAIVASTDGPVESDLIRQRYEDELARLRTVAIESLRQARDDQDFVFAVQALMAFENGGVWQRHLGCLANGELEFDCPSCQEHLLMDLTGAEAESFGDGSLAPTSVSPVTPPGGTAEERLPALARANNYIAIADKLPYLFGTTSCPHCRTAFDIRQALT